ncbi:MAG: RNA methyltransferase [Balneolaceae bacterium]|nr:RNA methyltransferase [Balneolaceae bacterium]
MINIETLDDRLKKELTDYLAGFITSERLETINRVLEYRTRYLTVVLEDIYQPHNASAVLRSCDGFGIQDVHIIEREHRFSPNKGVSIGADQWLTLHRHRSRGEEATLDCVSQLKERGYRVIAATPHEGKKHIDEIGLDKKTAVLFGAELEGLSDTALEASDDYAMIPIAGFVESFNISVSAAVCFYALTDRLWDSEYPWRLSDKEKAQLRLEWVVQSLRAGERLVEKFLEEREGDS